MKRLKRIYLENRISIIVFLFLFIILNFPLPYYIDVTGGIMNTANRIKIAEGFKSEGSINIAYVNELHATIPLLIISYFNKNWDVIKEEDMVLDNETIEELNFRDRLDLKEAVNTAIILAYSKAGKTVEISDAATVIVYVESKDNTDLVVEDKIISVDGIDVTTVAELIKVINSKQVGDKLSIKVENNKKTYTRFAKVKEEDGKKYIGIYAIDTRKVTTIPEVKLYFKDSETGPSGGFISTLAIYDYLTEEDITHGLKIVGTGTIDLEGNVGAIGGVKYKLAGAVKNHADIFFVPNEENYAEAIKLKEENNYDIRIVGISTFDEAIDYLNKLK